MKFNILLTSEDDSTAPLLESQRTARNLGVGIATTGTLFIAVVGIGMGTEPRPAFRLRG